jgi:PilZ domain
MIEYGGIKVDCTLSDLSTTGAALDVFDPNRIPANFTLIVKADGLKLRCRVVRRTEFRLGVAFE